jgi:hypothetical protein
LSILILAAGLAGDQPERADRSVRAFIWPGFCVHCAQRVYYITTVHIWSAVARVCQLPARLSGPRWRNQIDRSLIDCLHPIHPSPPLLPCTDQRQLDPAALHSLLSPRQPSPACFHFRQQRHLPRVARRPVVAPLCRRWPCYQHPRFADVAQKVNSCFSEVSA